MKTKFTNELLLYPCPVLLVTSRYKNTDNVFTVSWSGIACSHPEYIMISIKSSRYSHSLIKQSGVFGVNIINERLLSAADYCGTFSGTKHDKFSECGFTKLQGQVVNIPLIRECPINIECEVEKIVELGSHDMFIGKVVNKMIDSDIDIQKIHEDLKPVAYFRPNYYALCGDSLGTYGKTFNLFDKA